MIDSLVNWVQSIFESNDCKKLHLLFFRGFQILEILTTFYALVGLRPYLTNVDPVYAGMSTVFFSSLVWTGIFVLIAEVGWRLVQKGSIVGFWIGLILSLMSLPSIKILLGAFGFYAFLNPRSQRELLQDSPVWLKDFLSSLKINFLDSK